MSDVPRVGNVFGVTKEQEAEKAAAEALPTELQGKSAAEVHQILSDEHQRLMDAQELDIRRADPAPEAPSDQTPPPPGQAPAQQAQPYGPAPPAQQQQEEAPNLLTDPDGFMDQQFKQRLAPLYGGILNSQRQTNKALFQQRVGEEEYKKYGEEIESFVNNLAPQTQLDPGSYEIAHTFVRGKHSDEIKTEAVSAEATKLATEMLTKMGIDTAGLETAPAAAAPTTANSLFQGPTGVPRTAPAQAFGGGTAKTPTQLSRTEKEIAGAFGMGDEEYGAYKGIAAARAGETGEKV